MEMFEYQMFDKLVRWAHARWKFVSLAVLMQGWHQRACMLRLWEHYCWWWMGELCKFNSLSLVFKRKAGRVVQQLTWCFLIRQTCSVEGRPDREEAEGRVDVATITTAVNDYPWHEFHSDLVNFGNTDSQSASIHVKGALFRKVLTTRTPPLHSCSTAHLITDGICSNTIKE